MKIVEFRLFDKNSKHFHIFRDSLDTKRKYLLANGIGHIVRHKDEITECEEELLWDKGIFNLVTAAGLLNVVYFYNMKVFGFRCVDEHERLMQEQYLFGEKDGRKYVRYSGRASKGVTGSIESKATPKVILQYADEGNPRCIVGILQKYLNSLPDKGRFYRKALVNGPDGNIRFGIQVVGIGKHTLSKIIPKMMEMAGIDISHRNITGHSGKVTCATRLYQKGFDEQAIKSRTGHRSNAVQFYKRSSIEMEQEISNCLQPPAPKVPCAKPCTVTSSSVPPQGQIKQEMPETPPVSANNTLEIHVPECINKIIIHRRGQKMTFEL